VGLLRIIKKACFFVIPKKIKVPPSALNLYFWTFSVKQKNHFKCMISQKTENLHCHHLYSKKAFSSLQFSLINGISINVEFHREFHKKYGRTTTVDNFIEYVQFLQTEKTRQLDQNQLNYLRSYLLKIRPLLISLLP
jgi:hypothetical protein